MILDMNVHRGDTTGAGRSVGQYFVFALGREFEQYLNYGLSENVTR